MQTPTTPDVRLTPELISRLPKTDLHCHLDGSLRLRTILDMAEEQGVRLAADDEKSLAKSLHMGENCESLARYLEAFDITLSVMQTEAGLYRSAYELGIDAAAEGCRLIEVRFSPLLHTRDGLPLTNIIEVVAEGLRQAKRETGIISGIVVCGIRNISPEASLRLAELAVAYKNKSVVGFDLAGEEANYPAKAHREAFYLIRNNNVNSTCHAGEAYGPESIHQALHVCGAHRIGHGCRLREDGDLLNYVNDHRITLEVCPSSNVQTGAVEDLASHPLKFYYDFGVRVTVNTDNRLMTDTSVSKEMWLCHTQMGLGVDALREFTLNGFKGAFLHYRKKQELVRRFMQQWDDVIEEAAAKTADDKRAAARPAKKTKKGAA